MVGVISQYYNPAVTIATTGGVASFLNGEGLNIGFVVTRSLLSEPDTARVWVDNLADHRVSAMRQLFSQTGRDTLTLRAGYDAAAFGLFSGDVRSFKTERLRHDTRTHIEADDGGDAYVDQIFDAPYPVAATAITPLIAAALARMGWAMSPQATAIVNAEPPDISFSLFNEVRVGKVSDLLDEIARRLRCRWYVRDRVFYLTKRLQSEGPPIVITRDALISEPTEDGGATISLSTLFDPRLVPGSIVTWEGRSIRIEHAKHEGESRSSSVWSTEIGGAILSDSW